jgi:hypothetical protein
LAIVHIKGSDVALSLKGYPIPTDDSGVVIFDDIGGYLGPADGLLCSANSSSFIAQYWSFPNGTYITNLPSYDVFGTSNCAISNGRSLYYSGVPKERGQFQCIFETSSQYVNITLNIVDLNVTGPNLIRPGEIAIAGEDVELSVNVTTIPEDTSVPYLWSVNGTNLLIKNSSRHQGIQTDTLTISDVQVEDQGSYACSVANSASGINVNSTKLVVGKYRDLYIIFQMWKCMPPYYKVAGYTFPFFAIIVTGKNIASGKKLATEAILETQTAVNLTTESASMRASTLYSRL